MATVGQNEASTLPVTVDFNLQQRYTELLEKRIAQLEALLDAGSEKESNKDKNKRDSIASKDDTDAKTDKETEAEKPKLRYRNLVRQWDKKTGAQEDVELGEIKKANSKQEIAFTFRRVMDPETGIKDASSEIDIEADGLRGLLKEHIGSDYPGQNFEGETVEMIAPFAPLVHNWDALEKALIPEPDDDFVKKQAREDLARLLDTVKAAPELEKYFKTRVSNITASITTYETMWTLFPPKTKIVAKPFLNTFQIFEVVAAPIPYMLPAPRKLFLYVWCWDWNGKEMNKVYYDLPIEKFRGTKDINQLACYPIKYHKDGTEADQEELCKALKLRGAKYNKIVRSKPGADQMYSYKGEAVSDRRNVIKSTERDAETDGRSNNDNERDFPDIGEKQHRKTVSINGKFIVDAEAFLQYGSGTHIIGDKEPAYVEDVNEQSNESGRQGEAEKGSSDDDFLLFPPRFLGYSTKEKMWGQFSVEQTLNAPGKKPAAFDKELQLETRYKEMIQALVDEHEGRGQSKSGDRTQVNDIVEDKGKGLVLLFHGPPGVGKTLTAETIADATGKPLFVVSVAEIGLNASKAEKNLEQMFYLAGKWEAVLLVDEADVFLEARTNISEPNRNALVSVLLRVLEYYQGIMILTTNRINSLDVAVQSRIHLAIRYDDLTKEQKQKIFRIFLGQLEPDSIRDAQKIHEYIDEYGSENKLNGRQIRNVVSSGLSLARSSAKEKGGDPAGRLDIHHLKQVLSITKDFQEQLEAITTEQRAQNEATRSRR